MTLKIVGNPKDVERYKKLRQVQNLGNIEIDPATNQRVVYDGLKRLGSQGFNTELLGQMQNNPWIKNGTEFRLSSGSIAPKAGHSYVTEKGITRLKQVEKKQFSLEHRLDIIGVANGNIVDRYDERLNPAGLIVTDFNNNRVLLVDHLYLVSAVVGRVSDMSPESDGVKFGGFVGDAEAVGGAMFLTRNQRDIMSLIGQRLVQTVSVGFVPKKIRAPVFNDDGIMLEPTVIEQWELLELSIVAIPANPASIFQQRQLAESFYKMLGESSPKHFDMLTPNSVPGKTITKTLAIGCKKGAKGCIEIIGDPDAVNEWRSNNNKSPYKWFIEIKQPIDSDEKSKIQTLIFSKEKFNVEQAVQWAKDHDFKTTKVDENEESIRIRQREPSDFEDDTFRTIELTTGIQAVIGILKEDKSAMTDEQAKALIDGISTLNGTMKEVSTGIGDLKGQNEKILGSIEGKGGHNDKEDEDKEKEKRLKAIEDGLAASKKGLTEVNDALGAIAKHLNIKAA